jgi:hypothetical protein
MRNPIFLVPGLGGTRLRECDSAQLVWLNVPLFLDCTSKIVKILDVEYNHTEKTFRSKYAIKPEREMGDLRAIANVSNPPTNTCSQFDIMIRFLEKMGKYRPGENLLGVPYDWRVILDKEYWNEFERELITLIEQQQVVCKNVKSVFITMSMGGLVVSKFLHRRSSEWKNKYISKVIAIAPPFGGVPQACLSLLTHVADPVGLDNYFLKDLFKNCAGPYFCQPNPKCFNGLKIFENHDGRDYTVDDMSQMLEGNVRDIYLDFKDEVLDVMDSGPGPEIEMHIVGGFSKDTIVGVDLCDPDHPRKITESDYYQKIIPEKECYTLPYGDGIVPYLSTSYWCNKRYADGTSYVKTIKIFKGREYEHSILPQKMEVIRYIMTLLEVTSIDDILSKC